MGELVREAECRDQRGIVELDHVGDAGDGGRQYHGAICSEHAVRVPVVHTAAG